MAKKITQYLLLFLLISGIVYALHFVLIGSNILLEQPLSHIVLAGLFFLAPIIFINLRNSLQYVVTTSLMNSPQSATLIERVALIDPNQSDGENSISAFIRELSEFTHAGMAFFICKNVSCRASVIRNQQFVNPTFKFTDTNNIELDDILDELVGVTDIAERGITFEQAGNSLQDVLKTSAPIQQINLPIHSNNQIIAVICLLTTKTIPKEQVTTLESCARMLSAKLENELVKVNLSQLSTRFNSSQSIAKIGSWHWDMSSNTCDWSDQVFELLGYSPKSFQPSIDALIEFAHYSDRRRLRRFLHHISEHIGEPFEFTAVHANGHEISMSILCKHGTDPQLINGVIRDLSKQREVDNERTELVSTISHELRTPLTAIKGSLSLLANTGQDFATETNQGLFTIASKNVDRLITLVDDILELDKASSEKVNLRLEDISLQDLVNLAAKEMQFFANEYSSAIITKIPAHNIVANIDPSRMSQVLTNLLSNAIKYSPENSEIVLKLEINEDKARIYVIDQGPGIPEDFENAIFERFSQVQQGRNGKIRSSGLGLNIAKTLVEKHGGKLGYFNNQDVGTTFYVEIAAVKENAITQPSEGLSTQSLMNHNELRVLVIEDDPATSRYLYALLSKLGLLVTTVNSVEQAKKELNTTLFDLVTIDIMLPDRNGLDFVRELEQQNATRFPVIVISAVADIMKNKPEHADLPVYKWFSKPVKHSEFIKVISQIVGEAQKRNIKAG